MLVVVLNSKQSLLRYKGLRNRTTMCAGTVLVLGVRGCFIALTKTFEMLMVYMS